MRAHVKPRRYDSERGCYVYDVSFKTRVELTERTVKVAEAFGLGVDAEQEHVLLRDFTLKLAEGDVVYITGESGSGKSVLLRALREDLGDRAADLSEVTVDSGKPIIDTVGGSFREALGLLSRVGLNDAYLFLRRYPELSDGQRYRYRIAKLIDGGRRFWLADEFCSTLDRTTARIVAYNMQKHARRSGATLIAATSHVDLEEDLSPSVLIRKGWGEEVKVEYRVNREAPECTAVKGITIREGTRSDYAKLSSLHYRDSRLPVPLRIYAAEKESELCGVIAYSYPGINAAGRRKAVGYRPRVEELNRDWAVISRVIVHPKYRTTGLGARLIRETLPQVGRRHVELIAVMAEYNPFAERAGMRQITVSTPDPSVTRAVEELRSLGFTPPLTSSEAYNETILRELSQEKVSKVKEVLLGVDDHLYKRLIGSNRAFVTRPEMEAWLSDKPPERLARCIKILTILGQGKAYLYWCRDGGSPP